MKLGAVVISRNDGYGGDQPSKAAYCLNSLLAALDEVIYVDWNSPDDRSLIEEIRPHLPHTGKLRHIQITRVMASELTNHSIDVQFCVEVLARNIGLRRLTANYLISCNADIMCLRRESIVAGIRNERTFHTIARRETPFADVVQRFPLDSNELPNEMALPPDRYGQHGSGSPIPNDPWSLITCCGDFQLAHRDIWYAMRGFEESLIMRGYTDSNVQRKAKDLGFDLQLIREIPIFHFIHYPGTGACGGTHNSGWNDAEKSLTKFPGTTNPETWGFADRTFPEEVI